MEKATGRSTQKNVYTYPCHLWRTKIIPDFECRYIFWYFEEFFPRVNSELYYPKDATLCTRNKAGMEWNITRWNIRFGWQKLYEKNYFNFWNPSKFEKCVWRRPYLWTGLECLQVCLSCSSNKYIFFVIGFILFLSSIASIGWYHSTSNYVVY